MGRAVGKQAAGCTMSCEASGRALAVSHARQVSNPNLRDVLCVEVDNSGDEAVLDYDTSYGLPVWGILTQHDTDGL